MQKAAGGQMKHGSLFVGIGGFDLGFERAGFQTIWQVEIDRFCSRILQRHFPKAKRYGDITKINPADLEKVDVITAGFPCQDLSVAGKRKGLQGERSGLFFELKRIVAGVRPAWIVVENVPGLFSSNRGRDFGLVLFHLAECGYGLAWRILDSRYFGVAQRRRRVFIVGCLGKPCPPEILFESEGVRRDIAKGGEAEGNFAKCLAGSTRIDYETEDFIIGTLQGGGKRGYRVGTEEARDGQLVVGTPVDPDRVRASSGFSRRLDGTPDGPRYRALGNAVTVNVAEWIAKRIMACEKNASLHNKKTELPMSCREAG
jgi:DNA (cytosine-5)-methyltransferase 1